MNIKDFKKKLEQYKDEPSIGSILFKELPTGHYMIDKDECQFININDIEDISYEEDEEAFFVKINGKEIFIEGCCDFLSIK
jgi:hypothetical protein